MDLGLIGLGRMGLNMLRRLTRGGHRVVGFSPSGKKRELVEEAGGEYAESREALVETLQPPRIIWLMVPAGDTVDDNIGSILPFLQPGDCIVDGGNSFYRDSQRRAAWLGEAEFRFIDAGVSGGIWGLENGYCIMAGGDDESVAMVEPIFRTLAQPEGYLHAGPVGAGHFVKMVHNGIEYGMLQAIGEGFEILHASEYPLDLHAIAHLWNHGSVVKSWLMELCERMYEGDQDLPEVRGYVEDSGEGRWTVEEAIRLSVPAPVITLSLLERFRSRQPDSYTAKVIAELRNQFGGHEIKKSEGE